MANKHTSVNNSTSKQLYSFSKSERFPVHASLNNKIAYDFKSEFARSPVSGSGRPFHQTSTRFSYYASPEKGGKLPGPSQYRLGNTFGKESWKPNQQYSFGVGKGDMKKLFIDEIRYKSDNSSPGPGRYNFSKKFGQGSINYSMAQRLPTDIQSLERSKKLPGPGHYAAPHMTGKDVIFSTVKSESRYSFGKAQDRFSVPTRKVPAPAPGVYSPMNNLNQNFNSTF